MYVREQLPPICATLARGYQYSSPTDFWTQNVSRHKSTLYKKRYCERNEAIQNKLANYWIASGFALAMTDTACSITRYSIRFHINIIWNNHESDTKHVYSKKNNHESNTKHVYSKKNNHESDTKHVYSKKNNHESEAKHVYVK
jgi:hypothetical protein